MSVPRRPSVAALRRGAEAFERELAAWQDTQRLRRAAAQFERELATWQEERRALRARERALEERERALEERERALEERERELEEARAEAEFERLAEELVEEEEELEQQPLPIERPGRAAPPDTSRAAPLPEPKPREVSEEELEELYEAIADQWGVPIDVAEQAITGVDVDTHSELAEYLEELHDLLDDLGYDIDVSDLWDMYYGYSPRSQG